MAAAMAGNYQQTNIEHINKFTVLRYSKRLTVKSSCVSLYILHFVLCSMNVYSITEMASLTPPRDGTQRPFS